MNRLRIKSAVILGFVLILLTSLFACDFQHSDPKYVISGYESKSEHYQKSGFQDYADYCVYRYNASAVENFENSEYYTQVKDRDVSRIKSYFDDFRARMEAGDRLDEYDFDSSVVNEGDFFNLYDEALDSGVAGVPVVYGNYNLCLFDKETATLYYIHANI